MEGKHQYVRADSLALKSKKDVYLPPYFHAEAATKSHSIFAFLP